MTMTDHLAPFPKPYRLRFALDCLMAVLLAVEGFCFVSAWTPLLPVGRYGGWTMLLAEASLDMGLLMLFGGLVASPLFRRQGSATRLPTFLVVALAGCWFAGKCEKADKQREAAVAIQRAGGRILYDYQLDEMGNEIVGADLPGPAWLRSRLGDDFFRSIAAVEFWQAQGLDQTIEYVEELRQLRKLSLIGWPVTDETLETIKPMTRLRWLILSNTAITDTGLESLKGLTELRELGLSYTRVTDAGLRHLKGLTRLRSVQLEGTRVTGDAAIELRRALPGCKTLGAATHEMQGRALLFKKSYDEAIVHFTEALKFDPDHLLARINRGYAWYGKKDYDKARADWWEAMKVDPQDSQSFNEISWLQATCPEPRCRDGKNAVAYGLRAVEMTNGKWSDAVDTLAAAYAESGDFAKACEWQTKAVGLANDAQKEDFRSRLELYKQGKPYRWEPKTE
jgi:tetratricopeptide (TPR) repeat protein